MEGGYGLLSEDKDFKSGLKVVIYLCLFFWNGWVEWNSIMDTTTNSSFFCVGKIKRGEGKRQFNDYIIPSAIVCKG